LCQSFNDNASDADAGTCNGLVNNGVDAGITLAGVVGSQSTPCSALNSTPAVVNVVVTAIPASGSISYTAAPTPSFVAQFSPAACYVGNAPAVWTVDNPTISTVSAAGVFNLVDPVPGPVHVIAHAGSFTTASSPSTVNVVVNAVDNGLAPAGVTSSSFAGATFPDNITILYPYANTVLPLGQLPPVIQWDNLGTAASAVMIQLRFPAGSGSLFTWSGVMPESQAAPTPLLPAQPRAFIPQSVWTAFEQAAKGAAADFVIQRIVGGNARQPNPPVNLIFATDQLKGTVYYQSYGTNLTTNYSGALVTGGGTKAFGAATLGIYAGATNPVLVSGNANNCLVCHSVASSGASLVTQNFQPSDAYSWFVNLSTLATTYMGPGPSNDGTYSWPAISPDGTYLFSNSGPLSGASSSSLSTLYTAPGGAPVAGVTGLPAIQARTPAFSPDAAHIAYQYYGSNCASAGATCTKNSDCCSAVCPGTSSSTVGSAPANAICGSASAEGQTVPLSCPPGEVITSIDFASYGTPNGSCGAFSMGSCNAPSSVSVFAAACVGQNSCSVLASNSTFPDPCVGTAKHLDVQATCDTPSPLCATASDNGTLTLACPPSQSITAINFASYGTPTGSCGAYSVNSSCNATTSVSDLQSACIGNNSCSVGANNTTFGDPCPGTVKSFDAQATCGIPGTICAEAAAEGDIATLTCPAGQTIASIDFASYGTPTGWCGGFAVSSCSAPLSVSVAQSACVGQSSCSVASSYLLFQDDPCPGVYKHLYLQATCSSSAPTGGHCSGGSAADGKSLASIDYNPSTTTFTNAQTLATPGQGGIGAGTVYYPYYLPASASATGTRGIVWELETVFNGRDPGGTRSQCDSYGPTPCQNEGTHAELWWTDVASKTSARLDQLNGLGYLPLHPTYGDALGTNLSQDGSDSLTPPSTADPTFNYEPTVLPQTSGGYAWIVFTSRRRYGNIATINPFWSDPRFEVIDEQPTTKKLWVAAVDLNAEPGTDPSHPAFYLNGQELLAGNSRGYWVLAACEPPGTGNGSLCTETADCCSPNVCTLDAPPAQTKHCTAPSTASCTNPGGSCTADVQCCGYPTNVCAQSVCTVPQAVESYAGAKFTHDYDATNNCVAGSTRATWVDAGLEALFPASGGGKFPTVNLYAQVGASATTLAPTTPYLIGTMTGPPADQSGTWTNFPIVTTLDDAGAGFALQPYLRLTIQLLPSSDGSSAPVLMNWRARFDCTPSN
jgi:hypothetical protein